MAVIDVTSIGKVYRSGGQAVVALDDVSFRLEAGMICGLIGPNGAGKTTLIKILAGLLRPNSGGGTVLGFDLLRQHNEIRARISLVAPTADVGIDNNLTVRQNLAFWAPVYGLRGRTASERVQEVLLRLDLLPLADAWPMHISAGQRQRLALARSLLARTPLLFLDEPTNKLDMEGVRSVRSLIAELNHTYGVTVVLTTHVMEEAEELCSEIAVLHHGRLITHQPTGALLRSLDLTRLMIVMARIPVLFTTEAQVMLAALPAVREASVGQRDAEGLVTIRIASADLRVTTPALLTWFQHHGWQLRRMEATPVTLNDVFAALETKTEVET